MRKLKVSAKWPQAERERVNVNAEFEFSDIEICDRIQDENLMSDEYCIAWVAVVGLYSIS